MNAGTKCSHCKEVRHCRCSYADCPWDVDQANEFLAVKDAEIARLQEQVETQRIGHQLTAKEVTDYLIRANKAEAGLEEMTRSCLAERAGRLAAEAERDRLRALAERVCWFDWSANDEDAVQAIADLRAALSARERDDAP